MNQQPKPIAKLIGQNGNIFNLVGIARIALLEAGLSDQATKITEEVFECQSYEEALAVIAQYVDIK